MRCLNCNAEMVNYDVITKKAELSYDVCEKCGSLWLDAGELDKMAFKGFQHAIRGRGKLESRK